MNDTASADEVLINFYTRGEEIANTITHAVGIVAVLGGIVMMGFSAYGAELKTIGSVVIYSLSLLSMYVASTAYHGAKKDNLKLFFRRMDYCSIYLLIAGTYTPLMLLAVGGAWGWGMLIAVWGLAGIGIAIKCFTMKECGGLSLYLYLIMGWLCMLCIRSMFAGMTTAGVVYMLAGGAAYTCGIYFFLRLRPYSHTIWHLFVLAGTGFHFMTVWELL